MIIGSQFGGRVQWYYCADPPGLTKPVPEMIPCCENGFERLQRHVFVMAANVSSPYFDEKAGEIITSAYTVFIAWKGLICAISGLDASDQRLIGWIDLSFPVFISAGAVRRRGMDFVADQLFDGRKIRALTVVDNFSRQCVAIHVGQSLKGEDVVAVMNHLKIVHLAIPNRIQVDVCY